MKKIMWLCNTPLLEIREELGIKIGGESWLQGISSQLRKQKGIELNYVFPQGKVQRLLKRQINGISFWGFYSSGGKGYELSKKREQQIKKIVQEIDPDIIHIFGTEFAHTLECIRSVSDKGKIVVSIQGLVSECEKVYTKKIPITEIFVRAADIESIWKNRCYFYRRGLNERTALTETENIIGRTAWDRRCAKKQNPHCRYFYCNETLREPFYEGKWDIHKIEKYSIYISQAYYPIKGFHVFLKAFGEVVKSFPDAHVYVAGGKSFLQAGDAYGAYINRLMERYGVNDRIKFLGVLPAEQVKEQLLQTHLTVMPSLLENSPNSIGEAMLLGTPIVAAEVGGIPSLVRNEKEALLYSGHSTKRLAECIKRIFADDELALRLSVDGRKRAEKLYDRAGNLEKLLKIYEAVEKSGKRVEQGKKRKGGL